MVPPPLSLPLCTLPPGPGPPRFVCYCEPESSEASGLGVFHLHVTDGAELWSARLPPDSEAARKARCGLDVDEDLAARFRTACQQQAIALSLREDRASLTLSGPTSTLIFDLSKVPSPEAAPRLQALTLGLAERVCSLEQRLAVLSLSPQLWKKQPSVPGRARGQQGLHSSYQTMIPSEAALELGSGDGVQGSPSSILASRARNRPVVWTLMSPKGTPRHQACGGVCVGRDTAPMGSPCCVAGPMSFLAIK